MAFVLGAGRVGGKDFNNSNLSSSPCSGVSLSHQECTWEGKEEGCRRREEIVPQRLTSIIGEAQGLKAPVQGVLKPSETCHQVMWKEFQGERPLEKRLRVFFF